MGFEIVAYEPSLQPVWDEAVRGARARSVLFERGYMDYHADRFTDASLLVMEGARVAALLPASRHGDEIRSHGGLTFGGLLSDDRLGAAAAVEAVGLVLAHLRATGASRLVYKPVPHVFQVVPAQEDLYALTVHGARLTGRDISSAVSRGGPVRYSSERRRALKKADPGLVLGRSDALEEFMLILAENLRARHDVEPVHSPAEIRLLADRFPDAIKLYVAADDGAVVAGVLVYESPVCAHAQYIAANERGRELRAQDALFHHLLAEVYGDKRWFDFGISNEHDGPLNAGLARNKEGFGARGIVFDRYELDLR
jgi:hypothetical protein